MVKSTESSRVVRTRHGEYLVQGLDCFVVAGDIAREIAAVVDRHVATAGQPPDAIVWDDCVLEFRSFNLTFSLLRVFVPYADPLVVSTLDNQARCALRLSAGSDFELPDVNEALRNLALAPRVNVAHASGLLRFVGWPEQAPMLYAPPPRPANKARSISIVMNYRDKSSVTIEALAQIQKQVLQASLEIILVDNQSRPREREAVEDGVFQLFADRDDVQVRHLFYNAPFNHSYQCNYGASTSTGEVIVMMSNDCHLVDNGTLQTMADWALEPGIGGVMPRIVGAAGAITSAGVSILPTREERREEKKEDKKADRKADKRALEKKEEDRRSLRIQDCEVDYLSRVVRQTVGVTFACAAVSRANWFAAGGLDAVAFPTEYNDADFSLRAARLGLKHMYIGTTEAHHQPGRGDRRTREQTDAILAELLKRHDLATFEQNNPYLIRMRRLPTFGNDAADQVCDLVRLYRMAHAARSAEGPAAGDLKFLRSFEGLVAAADLARDVVADPLDATEAMAKHANLFEKIRNVCGEYLRVSAPGAVSQAQVESYQASYGAMQRLTDMAKRSPRPAFLPPAEPVPVETAPEKSRRLRQALTGFRRPSKSQEPSTDPDPQGAFFSYSDRVFDRASQRLLVFADAMGPSQQSIFLTGLNRARRAGEMALRIFSEGDIERLISWRGDEHLADHIAQTIAYLRPTACVFSRFSDAKSYAVIADQVALANLKQVFLIDDDLLHIGADSGIERYRLARNPRRVATIARIAASSDLLVTSTPMLAERLKPYAGSTPIACAGLLAGGRPAADLRRVKPAKIGYFASAAHDADLAMIVPSLLRIRHDNPSLPIEIFGEVAGESAALSLGDAVRRESSTIEDYARFRKSLTSLGWTIGLAPLRDTAFNATKSPVKWLEYAEAGIATIASNTPPYRELGREGALLLAGCNDWHGRISELLHRDERRLELLAASNRVLARDHSWRALEGRLLSLFGRPRKRSGLGTFSSLSH